MTFKKELLLTPQGIESFLHENKSQLRTIADDLGVGYSTLKNYAYGQTPIDSMPYRLLKALTDYLAPEDLLHPKTSLTLNPPAFYALLSLSRPDVIEPYKHRYHSYTIMEYTKALLLLLERQKQAEQGITTFEPRYFFVDFKYQEKFLTMDINITPRQTIVYQSLDQLKEVYGLTDEEVNNFIQTDKDQVYMSSTDPDLFRDILSETPTLPQNEQLHQLFHGAYNIHLIATNLKKNTPLIPIENIIRYNAIATTIDDQSTYIFENNQWQAQTGDLLQPQNVTHLKETDWTTLSRPNDLMVYKSVLRNLVNKNATENDTWDTIINRSLFLEIKNLTSLSNLPTNPKNYLNENLYQGFIAESKLKESHTSMTAIMAKQINREIRALKNPLTLT